MTTQLADRLATIAAHLAHYSRGIPPASAARTVRTLVGEAWSAYQEAGAPLGDDDAGLARWTQERPRRPPIS
jgi:hypothetical protein